MEPGTELIILGAAIGCSAEILQKLLGPTADYLGGELKSYTEKRLKNLRRIFNVAITKLGSKIETSGQIPPRILKKIWDEGYSCEDELASEYLGGVLASSRTGISRDDRAISYLHTISRLSSYQLRAHYIFYFLFKKIYNRYDTNLAIISNQIQLFCYLPNKVFHTAMSFTKDENTFIINTHILNGLVREKLIGPTRLFGGPKLILSTLEIKLKSPGIVIQPSTLGMELFLWANNFPNINIKNFLDEKIKFELLPSIEIPDGSIALKDKESPPGHSKPF